MKLKKRLIADWAYILSITSFRLGVERALHGDTLRSKRLKLIRGYCQDKLYGNVDSV